MESLHPIRHGMGAIGRLVIILTCFWTWTSTSSWAQVSDVERFGAELELGRRARVGIVRYFDYDAYRRIDPQVVERIPAEIVDRGLRTPEQFAALSSRALSHMLETLGWEEGPELQTRAAAEWESVQRAWREVPLEIRRAVLQLNLLDPEDLAAITIRSVISPARHLVLRPDTPVEIRELLGRFEWSYDGSALEFRHRQPQVGPSDYVTDVQRLAALCGMSERLAQGSSLIRRAGGRGGTHFSYHLHYSRAGRDLRPMLELLNLRIAQHIESVGGAAFPGAHNGSGPFFSRLATRGLVRLVSNDHIELRRHFTDPTTEARLLNEWVAHPARLAEEVLNRLTPEFLERAIRGAGMKAEHSEALRSSLHALERLMPGALLGDPGRAQVVQRFLQGRDAMHGEIAGAIVLQSRSPPVELRELAIRRAENMWGTFRERAPSETLLQNRARELRGVDDSALIEEFWRLHSSPRERGVILAEIAERPSDAWNGIFRRWLSGQAQDGSMPDWAVRWMTQTRMTDAEANRILHWIRHPTGDQERVFRELFMASAYLPDSVLERLVDYVFGHEDRLYDAFYHGSLRLQTQVLRRWLRAPDQFTARILSLQGVSVMGGGRNRILLGAIEGSNSGQRERAIQLIIADGISAPELMRAMVRRLSSLPPESQRRVLAYLDRFSAELEPSVRDFLERWAAEPSSPPQLRAMVRDIMRRPSLRSAGSTSPGACPQLREALIRLRVP